jgi:predicted porin
MIHNLTCERLPIAGFALCNRAGCSWLRRKTQAAPGVAQKSGAGAARSCISPAVRHKYCLVTYTNKLVNNSTEEYMMKKRMIAVAALALVSGMAMAQSAVTVYGTVDLGVLTQNHAPAGTSKTTMANGGIAPSIWGFRGSEDLGDGLKAVFNLEGHFDADTGISNARLFRRQSNVGFSSPNFGTVLLGNQYSPAILAFAATDPRGMRENFSALYPWAFNSGGSVRNPVTRIVGPAAVGVNTNSDAGVFLLNAISYGHTIGPVGVGAAYSLSERTPARTSGGSVYSLGLTYSGPFSASAAYQSTKKTGTSDRLSTIYTVGAGYTMGAFSGKANFLRGKNRDVVTLIETSKVDVFGLGVDWKTASNNTASAAVYYAKDKNQASDKTTTFLLSDEYSLSKRTTLYGMLAYADARAGASALTSVILTPTLPDTNTTLLNIGVKHTF